MTRINPTSSYYPRAGGAQASNIVDQSRQALMSNLTSLLREEKYQEAITSIDGFNNPDEVIRDIRSVVMMASQGKNVSALAGEMEMKYRKSKPFSSDPRMYLNDQPDAVAIFTILGAK